MADANFPGQGVEAAEFQDQVATSLLPEREQAVVRWEEAHPGEDFWVAANSEPEAEPEPDVEPAEDDNAELPEALASPEERFAYQNHLHEFDALPQEQQVAEIDSFLTQAYSQAADSIDAQTAKNFVAQIGPLLGEPRLAEAVDPVVFSTFSEAWSSHLETQLRLHPQAPAFLAALQSGNDQRALKAAEGLCNNYTMLQIFKDQLGAATGHPQFFADKDPMELAASWITAAAKMMGYGERRRPRDDFADGLKGWDKYRRL
jgi:hypothetical protein